MAHWHSLSYEDDEVIEPVTNAWAPKQWLVLADTYKNRRGCGYVFCDSFYTDVAHAELEQTLGRKVEPTRHIKFDSGRSKKPWIKKNVLSTRLCAAFAELRGNKYPTTIMQLKHFIRFLGATRDSKLVMKAQYKNIIKLTPIYMTL